MSLAKLCLQKTASRICRTSWCRQLSSTVFLQSQSAHDSLSEIGKYELQAKQVGNDNPFDTYVLKPDAITGLYEKSPIIVPSTGEKRIVGCCCEADYDQIIWFELSKGQTQRCDCGFYFKLINYDPLDKNIRPTFGRGFGSGMSKYY